MFFCKSEEEEEEQSPPKELRIIGRSIHTHNRETAAEEDRPTQKIKRGWHTKWRTHCTSRHTDNAETSSREFYTIQ
jgi:hypothetical protein